MSRCCFHEWVRRVEIGMLRKKLRKARAAVAREPKSFPASSCGTAFAVSHAAPVHEGHHVRVEHKGAADIGVFSKSASARAAESFELVQLGCNVSLVFD